MPPIKMERNWTSEEDRLRKRQQWLEYVTLYAEERICASCWASQFEEYLDKNLSKNWCMVAWSNSKMPWLGTDGVSCFVVNHSMDFWNETFLRFQGVATERCFAPVSTADANLIPHRPHPAHPIQMKMHQTQQIQQKASRFHRSLQAAPEAKEDGSAPCFVLHFPILTVHVPHELTGKTFGSTLALSISIVAFPRQGSSMHFNLLGFHIHFPVWFHTIGGWLPKSISSETGWKGCNDEFARIVVHAHRIVHNTAVKQNFTL